MTDNQLLWGIPNSFRFLHLVVLSSVGLLWDLTELRLALRLSWS